MDEITEKLAQIFFPYSLRKTQEIQKNKTRFVHYTSARAAMNIIKTGYVWMRQSSCMNDFMEVEYGYEQVRKAYKKDSFCGKKFQDALNSIFDGFTSDIEEMFNDRWPNLESDTYFTCVSEHEDREDITGRLSMWRAYSQGAGTALVMNTVPFLAESNALNAYTSPVAYLNDEQFQNEFCKIADNISANADFIKQLPREVIIEQVFHMLTYAAVSTKHPGFIEEKEWRVIYFPTYSKSRHIKSEIEVVNGIPQHVHKIPLHNIPDEGFVGAAIPELLDRIIIGPTADFPTAMCKAFVSLLIEAGVENPEAKVWASNIPLRG